MVEILPFLVARKVSREEKSGYAVARLLEEEKDLQTSRFVSFHARSTVRLFPSLFSLIIGFRRHHRWRITSGGGKKRDKGERKIRGWSSTIRQRGSFDSSVTLILFINSETKRLTSLVEWISYGKTGSLVFLLISGRGRGGSIFLPNLISFVMEISGNARFIHLLTTGSLWFHDALMKMNGFEKMSSWFNRLFVPSVPSPSLSSTYYIIGVIRYSIRETGKREERRRSRFRFLTSRYFQ